MKLCLDALLPGVLPSSVKVPRYDPAAVGTGIVHFGPGAFHRVHQAWYAQQWLEKDPRWGIAGVSLNSRDVRDALAPQDGLYTLAVLDENVSYEVIGSIRQVIFAPESPGEVIAGIASPETHLITLTVTEKGYCLDAEGSLDFSHPGIRSDLSGSGAPTTVIGYLVEGLRQRRDGRLGAVPVVSCDNLADNGRRLRTAVMEFAVRVDPGLASWIGEEVPFPGTMVDSITPATTPTLKEQVLSQAGLLDAWPVQREAFTQWVVERHEASSQPDWEAAGVILTNDVSGFERAKLRLLNGAHSTLAYVGLLRGHTTVLQAMQDPEMASFIRRMMEEDIAPSLTPPEGLDLPGYMRAITQRFSNPAVRHELSQIAWDGSKKLPIRILGTVSDSLASGRSIARLCVPLAAWMHFIRQRHAADGEIVDPIASRLKEVAETTRGIATHDVKAFLEVREVFAPVLAAEPRFISALEQAYDRLGRSPSLPPS